MTRRKSWLTAQDVREALAAVVMAAVLLAVLAVLAACAGPAALEVDGLRWSVSRSTSLSPTPAPASSQILVPMGTLPGSVSPQSPRPNPASDDANGNQAKPIPGS